MNKFACIKLLAVVTQPTHGVIVFKQHFKDESAWSEAFMDNVSTKVFDYNEHLKKHPEDVYTIENYEVKESCKDNPLIYCKHFTVVNKGPWCQQRYRARMDCKAQYACFKGWTSLEIQGVRG